MIEQVLVAVITCLVFAFFLNRNKRLPPGPWKLPVLGSTIQLYLAHPTLPYLAFSKLAEKYGEIFSFGFGSQLCVMVSSFEAMQQIFKLNATNASRAKLSSIEDRNFGKNLGIIFASGQNWLEMRTFTKKIIREYGYGKIKVMEKSLNESANQLVDVIKTELLDSRDGCVTVKSSTFSVHVFNIMWAMIGGYKFESNDASLAKAMKCLDKAVEVFGTGNIYNTFPFMKKWFPNLVNYPEHLKIHEEIHAFSQFLINNAIEKRSERLDSEPISFIEVFLDKIDEENGNPASMYTMEQLQIILEDIFLGSMETTGNFIGWALLFMVLNPDKQNKVRQVIFDKVANTDALTATELKRIPYVKATILEVFRVGNAAAVPAPRFSTGEIKYRDYTIPKDTILFYNLYPMYNDKAFWQDPETFRPERFLDQNGEIDRRTSDRIMNTVFGVGPRVCFGDVVGMDSLYTYFATLIVNFKFDAIRGQEPSADNCHFALAICPDDFNAKVTKLSK